VDSYLKQIEEKRKKIEELEIELEKIEPTKNALKEKVEQKKEQYSKNNSLISSLELQRENLQTDKKNLEKEIIRLKDIRGIYISIIISFFACFLGLFSIRIASFYSLFNKIIGLSLFFTVCIFDDIYSFLKDLKSCRNNIESITTDLVNLESLLKDKKEICQNVYNEFLEVEKEFKIFLHKSGYMELDSRIKDLRQEKMDLDARRKKAIDEVLNDLFKQNELNQESLNKFLNILLEPKEDEYIEVITKQKSRTNSHPNRFLSG